MNSLEYIWRGDYIWGRSGQGYNQMHYYVNWSINLYLGGGGCLQVGEHVSGSLQYYIADLLGTDAVFSGDPFGVEPDLLLL